MEKLKRVVLKEELVALTKDYTAALILQQFIYWSERTQDFDKFINEEVKRANAEGMEVDFELTGGWIYKTSEEMAEETLTYLAPANMRNHIKKLIERGWLDERRNPKYKFDKTYQYRINLFKIAHDLHTLGYRLEGYKYDLSEIVSASNADNFRTSQNENSIHESKIPDSNRKYQTRIEKAIPEITTEITTEKEKSQSVSPETGKVTQKLCQTTDGQTNPLPSGKTEQQELERIYKNAQTPLYTARLFIENVIKKLYTERQMPYILKMGLTHTEIQDRLRLLAHAHLDAALSKMKGVKTNKELYFAKCLLTAIVELDLDELLQEEAPKPTTSSNTEKIPQRDTFEQREYSDKELEKRFYANLN